MKQFFEQYGAVALGILALLVLIAMITPVGNLVKTSLQGTVQTFSAGMESQTDTMTESMKEAFDNASGFTGVKNNIFYYNGEIHPLFAENGLVLSENGNTATDKNGIFYYRIYADVNVILDDSSHLNGGIYGLFFDLYLNGTRLTNSNNDYYDYCLPVSLKNNDEIKLVIKSVPQGYKVNQTEFVYHVQEQEFIFLSADSAPVLCIDMPIYTYTA